MPDDFRHADAERLGDTVDGLPGDPSIGTGSQTSDLIVIQIIVAVSVVHSVRLVAADEARHSDETDGNEDDDFALNGLDAVMRSKLAAFMQSLRNHHDTCGFISLPGKEFVDKIEAHQASPGDEHLLVAMAVDRSEYRDQIDIDMSGTFETLAQAQTDQGRNTVSGFRLEATWLHSDDQLSPLPIEVLKQRATEQGGALAPLPEETTSGWLERIRISEAALLKLWERWEKAGFMLDAFVSMGPRRSRSKERERLRYLVPGLIPFGEIVLWGGVSGAGKSSVLLDLARIVGSGACNATWLGIPVTMNEGTIALFAFGEDSQDTIDERLDLLDPEDQAEDLWPVQGDSRKIDGLMDKLDQLNRVGLLIVDPARKYLFGDEDSSTTVDAFLARLEDFAHRTGAAVVVTHHLKKDLAPSKVEQFRGGMRGATTWVDRARVAVGMYRAGSATKVGIFKHNMPANHVMMSERAFHFDQATGRLEVPTVSSDEVGGANDQIQDAVLAAIRGANSRGHPTFKSGKFEVHRCGFPELEGRARAAVRAAVLRLITLRALVETPNGLVAITAGDDLATAGRDGFDR